MDYYIYLLECSDKKYYTGVTNDLIRRIWEHQNGIDPKCYTYSRRPVKLMYSENFPEINYAIVREKQIKGWNRKKKEALTSGEFNKLQELSRSNENILRQAQDDKL